MSRFARVLNWTCEDQENYPRIVGSFVGAGVARDVATEALGPPAPWPIIMLAQRLHWHGRTQEAYDIVRSS